MKIPLSRRLRKSIHRKIAYAEDLMVIEVYNQFTDAVLHGGTVVWRCFGGNRFSEDIDVILPREYVGDERIYRFRSSLEDIGFKIGKFRVKENSIYSRMMFQGVEVRFEAVFKDVERYLHRPFELVDGNYIYVNVIPPSDMIIEKVDAYLSRYKIRDLYDITILLKYIDHDEKAKDALNKLLDAGIKPVDEKDLKVLILFGGVPIFDDLMEEIRRWVRRNIQIG